MAEKADRGACPPGSGVLLSRLAKQIYRRVNEEALGMHMRHLIALSYVSDHDGCPQQDLADAFCMDANNVVLLLNELEDEGYATRQRDPDDRRRHLVRITPSGRKALNLAERAQVAIEDEVLDALDPDERRKLRELLDRALRSVEPTDAESTSASPSQGDDDDASPRGDAYSATVASIST